MLKKKKVIPLFGGGQPSQERGKGVIYFLPPDKHVSLSPGVTWTDVNYVLTLTRSLLGSFGDREPMAL